jgi:DNA-binding transcriptional MocR family regulator
MDTPQATAAPWHRRIDRSRFPIYHAIAEAIAQAIGSGELREGERLPAHRALAAALGVDLTTVTRAYTEARRRGLLDATVGRGTFVRSGAVSAPMRADRHAVVDMTMNLPPQPEDPGLRALLQEGLTRLMRQQDLGVLMAYRLGAGTAEDQSAGAAWLAPTMGRIDPQRLMVCPGAQAAMTAVLSTIAEPGDVILTERLTYPGIRALGAQLRLMLAGVETDAEGFLPDALDRACAEQRPRAIYCNPTIQNPTTYTMSAERRQAVVAIARRHDVPILEDDTYGLLPAEPLPALAALAPELVFHVVTTAKTLSPGLRTAYLVAPTRVQAARLTAALRATALMGSGLLTGLVTLWMRGGQAQALLAGIRREAASRQQIAASVLAGTGAWAHPDGLHVWVGLPAHWNATDFVAYVRRLGLALVPGSAFAVEGAAPDAVRVALGAAPNREMLRESLASVASALQRQLPAGYSEVV